MTRGMMAAHRTQERIGMAARLEKPQTHNAHWLYRAPEETPRQLDGLALVPGRFYILATEWVGSQRWATRTVAAGPAETADGAWKMLQQ